MRDVTLLRAMTDSTENLICELQKLVVETLDLEDISPEEIGADTPLFSDNGLGSDSIDAMELGVALKRRYKITITAETENVDQHFSTLASLAAFIRSQAN